MPGINPQAWHYLNIAMRWIYRIVLATLLTLVLVSSITALAAGVAAAIKEWGIWEGLNDPKALGDLFSSIGYRTVAVALGSYVAGYLFMQFQYRNIFGIWFRPLKDSRQLPVERLAKLQQGMIAKEALRDFATRYTKAWCSQDAASVASFFSTNGSLKVNDNPRAVGRDAISEVAQGFMTAFPDMRLTMDDLRIDGERAATYSWTLTGQNSGPGGTDKPVRISGQEVWKIGDDGLIAKSRGSFDKNDYERQLGNDTD